MNKFLLVGILSIMSLYAEGEFLLDTNIVFGPIAGGQDTPAIAFDGTNYLVVWHSNGIWCSRVNQTGVVLDTAGIQISASGANPAVAFDGTNYLAVWQDGQNINGARVDQGCNLLDPVPKTINSGSEILEHPAIVFGDSNYMVAWQTSYQVYCARVDQQGIVIDTAGILIPRNAQYPAISFDGTNHLVVYESTTGGYHFIYGSRVDQSGVVLDTFRISRNFSVYETIASIVFGGSNYFVAFQNSEGVKDIYGARVTTGGILLDTTNILICSANYDNLNPVVTYNGMDYLLTWSAVPTNGYYDSTTIYGARVSQSGVVLDPSGFRVSHYAPAWYPAIACDGNYCMTVWGAVGDIFGAIIDQSGNVQNPADILITIGTYGQYNSALGFDGANYLVAWQDERHILTTNYDIYGTRVAPEGTILDPNSIAISTANSYQQVPAVAYSSNQSLVVWQDSRFSNSPYWETDIFGTRVSPTGTVLDPSGIAIALGDLYESLRYPATCSNGTNYFVVWQNENPYKLRGAIVNTSGAVVASFDISSGTGGMPFCPSVTFGGSYYLVVWHECREIGYTDIWGARITPAGTVIDVNGFGITTYTLDSTNYYAKASYDGTNYLVVWQRRCAGVTHSDIYGARVDQSGQVLDLQGVPICNFPANQLYPAVAYGSQNNYHVVTWNDRRSDPENICGALVSSSGGISVIDTIAVTTQDGIQTNSAVAKGPGSQFLVTYTGWTPDISGQTVNTNRIWGKFLPVTSIEESENKQPEVRYLLRVHPNPFSDKVSIVLRAETKGENALGSMPLLPCIDIYDVTGRVVKNFSLPTSCFLFPASMVWDGTDDLGRRLPAGIYFIGVANGTGSTMVTTEKVILLK